MIDEAVRALALRTLAQAGGSAVTRIGGPFFEDLEIGELFDRAPALTLTEGHAAMHQAIIGGDCASL